MLSRVERDVGLAPAFTRMCRRRRQLPCWCLRSLLYCINDLSHSPDLTGNVQRTRSSTMYQGRILSGCRTCYWEGLLSLTLTICCANELVPRQQCLARQDQALLFLGHRVDLLKLKNFPPFCESRTAIHRKCGL